MREGGREGGRKGQQTKHLINIPSEENAKLAQAVCSISHLTSLDKLLCCRGGLTATTCGGGQDFTQLQSYRVTMVPWLW